MRAINLGRERLLSRPRNLDFLLRRRTQFIRDVLPNGARTLEVGAGLGIAGLYLEDISLVSTDLQKRPWLDAIADLEQLPFKGGVFDAVICLNVLHHLNTPRKGLEEMLRVLRVGGLLFIAEPHLSWGTRLALLVTRHEHIDRCVDPFRDEGFQRRDAPDGNNATGDLLFQDMKRFTEAFPLLRLIHHRLVEFLTFVNSGGVGYRALYLPMPWWMLRALGHLDDVLTRLSSVFPTSREVIFVKVQPWLGREERPPAFVNGQSSEFEQ